MPYSSKIQQAFELYLAGNHAQALRFYHELGAALGHQLFYANQLMCLAALQPDGQTIQELLQADNIPPQANLLQALYSEQIIVSLTSYPARIECVADTIASLLQQSLQPQKIILWLASEQFPQGEQQLPADLLQQTEQGLQIGWCEDLRSYKKLIPTLALHPEKVIVTADDDILYPPDWLARLLIGHLQHSEAIICHRAHQVLREPDGAFQPYAAWPKEVRAEQPSMEYLFTGNGGVLYPAGSLHADVLQKERFQALCPTGDDLWFWAMAVLNNRPVMPLQEAGESLTTVPASQAQSLWHNNVSQGGNDAMLKNLLHHYPELTKACHTQCNGQKSIKVAEKG